MYYWISQASAIFATVLTVWFCIKLFTARYALKPCVKQTHFSFKWLILVSQMVGHDLKSPLCPLYYRSLNVIYVNLNG